jgi:hypothetical protein
MDLRIGLAVAGGALGLLAPSCTCCPPWDAVPCSNPVAVRVTLTAQGVQGPVSGAYVKDGSNPATSCESQAAASVCTVAGGPGTQTFDRTFEVGAPGPNPAPRANAALS